MTPDRPMGLYPRFLCFLFIIYHLSLFITPIQAQQKPETAPAPKDTTLKTRQPGLSFEQPEEVEIDSIRVSGISFLDPDALTSISGLKVGDRVSIPGEAISSALRKLWDQGLLSDAEISVFSRDGYKVGLDLRVKERPRLSRFSFKGAKRGEANDLREKVGLIRGRIVTDAVVKNATNIVRRFYVAKGYFNTKVKVETVGDSAQRNTVGLRFEIDKGQKVKIGQIIVEGNQALDDKGVRKRLKDTKQINKWRIFKPSRYVQSKFEKDKDRLMEWYAKNGYRDASYLGDSTYRVDEKTINLVIRLEEGRKFYFRKIDWTGNYLYDDKTLSDILGINKGQEYDQQLLEKKLTFNPNGADVSSLYMDDGYLFFRVEPVEVGVEGDSIDIEMRVYEGTQATINRINISGNTKTSDHVILREIRTLPGQKFSRTDLIRTQRELSTLGYFDPEQIGINPVPNPQNGTVDINYSLAEKPNDQIQLQGGWGGYYGFVGTLSLAFNNFSMRRAASLRNWKPLPAGDGQRLSLSLQANGRTFQTYSASFSEPWLGGRRPNSFTTSLSRSIQNLYSGSNLKEAPYARLGVTGLTFSLGRRLRFPDDYFSFANTLSLQRFNLANYPLGVIPINNGGLNQISFVNTLSRASLNNPIFPTAGSSFTLAINLTPPYSVFNRNPNYLKSDNRYRFVEFHKWNFDGSYFVSLAKNLVLNTRAHFGAMGYYTKQVGIGPFERFKMGGSGITGFNWIIGYDIIGLRGYNDNSIGPQGGSANVGGGGILFNKYVTELRYAISTNPAATIFALTFIEGGNNVGSLKEYNPFNVYRSAGVGIRIMMPAFGLLGVDYGKALDGPASQHQNFTFSIGQQIR